MVTSSTSPRPDGGPFTLIVVGCGSRGLSVLERVAALAASSCARINVLIVDPQEPGPGLHSPEQPDYLMLNTVASQLSMFPDAATLDGARGREGPNFHQWCLRHKFEPKPGRYAEEHALPAAPTDFLPRSWLGEYLAWTYRHVIESLPPNMSVRHLADRAVSVDPDGAGGFTVVTAAGHALSGSALVVTIGHATVDAVVPGRHDATGIEPDETVAVEGLGLAAMDAIAELTTGTGGRFHRDGMGTLRYQRSGLEPRIVMYSRGGLPYRTRPDVEADATRSSPVIFTLEAVAQLRRRFPQEIDFERHVLPLLKAEMIAAYYGTAARCAAGTAAAGERQRDRIATWFAAGVLDERAGLLADTFGHFDPAELLLTALPANAAGSAYQQWMRTFIAADLHDSRLGLARSPLKAAAEVWRDCREQLRRLVDDQGLAPASERLFYTRYAPLVNRLVAGPQKERHDELLALMDAGIVAMVRPTAVAKNGARATLVLGDGGSRITVRRVLCARIADNRRPEYQPEVIASMRDTQILQSIGDDGYGVRTDAQGRAIDPAGSAVPNLWLLGPVVEGSTYYNHYVPSAGAYSRAFMDAHRIATAVVTGAPR